MGFVKVPHDLREWGWINEPKTVYVYLRLLLDAAWSETERKGVPIKRGQLIISQREYAEKLGITYQELRTALLRLIATHKITQSATHKKTIVTLLEYDLDTQSAATFQRNDNAIATQSQRNSNPPTLLNKKEKNKRTQENARAREGGESESELLRTFDIFWEKYPRKTSKQQAITAWKRIKPDGELVEEIMSSLERHKKSEQWIRDNGRYIPYPATWLNGRRWEDEITEVKDNGTEYRDESKVDWYAGF